MVYAPGDLDKRTKDLLLARKWGIALIGALVGVKLLAAEYSRLKDAIVDPMTWGYLALFAVAGVLIFLWIWASQKEFDLIVTWLDPDCYEPPSSLKETVLILSLAVVLIAMLFAARSPALFGLVFTAYSGANIIATRLFNTEFATAVAESRRRLDEDLSNPALHGNAILYGEGVTILTAYYFGRPQMKRQLVIFTASVAGLAMAIAWWRTGAVALGIASYAVFFGIIVVSEVVIYLWRQTRDGDLRPVLAALRSQLRAQTGLAPRGERQFDAPPNSH